MSSYGNGWQEILLQNGFTSVEFRWHPITWCPKKIKIQEKKPSKTEIWQIKGRGRKIKPKKESVRIISNSLRYCARSTGQHGHYFAECYRAAINSYSAMTTLWKGHVLTESPQPIQSNPAIQTSLEIRFWIASWQNKIFPAEGSREQLQPVSHTDCGGATWWPGKPGPWALLRQLCTHPCRASINCMHFDKATA